MRWSQCWRWASGCSPPFGVGFYAAGAIGRIDPNLGIRPIQAYLFAMLLGLVVVAAIPWVSIGFL